MSTETKQVIDNTEVVKKDQLQSKYNKFKVFGHWIIGRIAEKLNNLDEEKKNALNLYEFMMDQHCLYSSVEDQTAYYELFLEENPKFSLKAINKEVRKHNKPIKVKKEKDPDAPKKKRGRKKKIVEDNTTEEEKYIANIVALQKDEIDEPNESILLRVSSISNAGGALGSIGSVTILDDDEPVPLSLERSGDDVNVYPNPFMDHITIELDRSWDGEVELSLYDMFGRVSKTKNIINSSVNFTHRIEISDTNYGLYIIKIKQKKKVLIKKLIREN